MIRRLVADLNLPVRIEGCPTVREPDGLSSRSRNARRSRAWRARARALPARRPPASARRRALLGRPVGAARARCRRASVEPETLLPIETCEPLAVARALGARRADRPDG